MKIVFTRETDARATQEDVKITNNLNDTVVRADCHYLCHGKTRKFGKGFVVVNGSIYDSSFETLNESDFYDHIGRVEAGIVEYERIKSCQELRK